MAFASCFVWAGAAAADLTTWQGFDIRWDNTLRYSAGFRLGSSDPVLVRGVNGDDGDRNFAPGLISNRLDLLSMLDVSKDDFGLHVSGAGWYDTVYHTRTANRSASTYNALSVPNTQFPRATRNLLGQYAELDDAFVYGAFTTGDIPVSFRVGRQTLLWGESLFFNQNSIAGMQAPYDYIKAASEPSGYSRDEYLPVSQVSVTVQPRQELSLALYYKLEWRPSRLPGVGSYFSYFDFMGAGSERIFAGPRAFFVHGQDRHPAGTDQFGVSLHTTINDLDLGFYWLRSGATYPVWKITSVTGASSGNIGTYDLAYTRGIQLYGISFSDYIADSNVAGEISLRRRMPLTSISPLAQFVTPTPTNPLETDYAEGDTLHAQISSVVTLGPASIWNSADLSVEAAANDLLAATHYANSLNRGRDRFAMSVRALFQPHYFEVLPNLDVTIPLGFGYNAIGNSSLDYTQNAGTGDFEIGASATYLTVWKASITLTSYLGGPNGQALADRDFALLRIERTF